MSRLRLATHRPFLAMSRLCLAMHRLFVALRHPFVAILCRLLAMRRASVGHRHPQRVTRSLVLTTPRQSRERAVAFLAMSRSRLATHRLFLAMRRAYAAPHDALAAPPSGLREVRRVLGATLCAFRADVTPDAPVLA